ncbi:MAG: hypothetical protein ABWK05_05330 [Pyrobaculum sp.]
MGLVVLSGYGSCVVFRGCCLTPPGVAVRGAADADRQPRRRTLAEGTSFEETLRNKSRREKATWGISWSLG